MNIFKKSLVAAVSTGLVVGGGAFMTPAFAQDTVEIPASLIQQLDEDGNAKKASLTIHKHSVDTTEGLTQGDGSELENPPANPLACAEFTITPITDIDLTTNEGWRAAEQIGGSVEQAKQHETAEPIVRTTGTDGLISLEGLDFGLYIVEETGIPADHAAVSESFVVALPMTNADRTGWNYDVHVYPKNKKYDATQPTKTVEDANKQAGETINYTITSPVKAYENDRQLTGMRIRDYYPTDRLENVQVTGVAGLAEGDYTVSTPRDGVVEINLTASGVEKVRASGEAVEVNLSATVLAIDGAEDGAVSPIVNSFDTTQTNDPNYDPNDPDDPEIPGTPEGPGDPEDPDNPNNPDDPENPDDRPRSYFGNVELKKTGLNDEGEKVSIAGAQFDVYTCTVDENGAFDQLVENLGEEFHVETAGEEGTALIRGLHVNNFVNNHAQTSDPSHYCLVETESPEGYELLAEPVPFQVNADLDNETVPLTRIEADIENVNDNAGFDLPLTGGNGVWYILGAGVLLLVMGGSYYILKRREA